MLSVVIENFAKNINESFSRRPMHRKILGGRKLFVSLCTCSRSSMFVRVTIILHLKPFILEGNSLISDLVKANGMVC